MRVVVFMKAVRSDLVYADETDPFVANPYDMYALSQVIEARKRGMDCEIIAVCMGPEKAVSLLKRAIALGADRSVLVSDRAFAGSDTVATAYILSVVAEKIGNADLIVCGQKAIDGETGQVSYGIAELVKYPVYDNLTAIEGIKDNLIYLDQKVSGGSDEIRVGLPAVLVFDAFECKRKAISLMALKRAARAEIEKWDASDLECDLSRCGQAGSKTIVISSTSNFQKKDENILIEDVDEAKELLIKIIKRGQLYGN